MPRKPRIEYGGAGYHLMGNQYHLMAQIPEPDVVVGMKWLQGAFTQRFNARHRQRGDLFQGRYRSCLVEAEGDYFGVLSTYIHLNPVRAGLIKAEAGGRLRDYRWSSRLIVDILGRWPEPSDMSSPPIEDCWAFSRAWENGVRDLWEAGRRSGR